MNQGITYLIPAIPAGIDPRFPCWGILDANQTYMNQELTYLIPAIPAGIDPNRFPCWGILDANQTYMNQELTYLIPATPAGIDPNRFPCGGILDANQMLTRLKSSDTIALAVSLAKISDLKNPGKKEIRNRYIIYSSFDDFLCLDRKGNNYLTYVYFWIIHPQILGLIT